MAEDKMIEKMAECCPYFWNGGCTVDASNPTDCDLMCEMFGFMTNLVRADFFNREWISVKDRLPKHEERCLIFTKIHFVPDHVDECDYYEGVEISTFYQDIFLSNNGMYATHWMYLPQPPETKGETE